jgi:hypothetical protein
MRNNCQYDNIEAEIGGQKSQIAAQGEDKQNIEKAIDSHTCMGMDAAEISQTLKVRFASLSRKATSQIPMSPTFVPTAKTGTVHVINRDPQSCHQNLLNN